MAERERVLINHTVDVCPEHGEVYLNCGCHFNYFGMQALDDRMPFLTKLDVHELETWHYLKQDTPKARWPVDTDTPEAPVKMACKHCGRVIRPTTDSDRTTSYSKKRAYIHVPMAPGRRAFYFCSSNSEAGVYSDSLTAQPAEPEGE